MGKVNYNKLVRDNIPEIIIRSGKHPNYIKLNDSDMVDFLVAKMYEELADLQTVLTTLIELCDSKHEFETIKTTKDIDRGKFKDRIFLIDVTE